MCNVGTLGPTDNTGAEQPRLILGVSSELTEEPITKWHKLRLGKGKNA